MTTIDMTWNRNLTSGGMTVYTSGAWRIESWGGRNRNGDRTGYRPGSVCLYHEGIYVRSAATVRDAKAAAERRENGSMTPMTTWTRNEDGDWTREGWTIKPRGRVGRVQRRPFEHTNRGVPARWVMVRPDGFPFGETMTVANAKTNVDRQIEIRGRNA